MTTMRFAQVFAAVILGIFIVMAIAAPWIAPYDPLAGTLGRRLRPPAWITTSAPVASLNWLGTDAVGRDVFSRLLHGARSSLIVAAAAIAVAGVIGTTIGMISGYFGGWTDRILMRIVDLALSFPMILLALLVGVVFGASLVNVVFVIALLLWSQYARMARGETLKIKHMEYVDLARTAGVSSMGILVRHVLPKIMSVLVVVATLQVGTVILLESSLSFLGVGVPPPTPSWGTMIADGRSYLATAWWLSLFPGLAILAVVLSVNVLGDALADRAHAKAGRDG